MSEQPKGIEPIDPHNSCSLCKADFKKYPWAKIWWSKTNNGCLLCANNQRRMWIETTGVQITGTRF